MRVGYAKIGRAMPLAQAKWGEVGGDNEPPILLDKLARMYPQHEFVIIGRNSGENPQAIGLPANVTNPWEDLKGVPRTIHKECGDDLEKRTAMMYELIAEPAASLDAFIVWAGQHGTSNQPIPKVGAPDELTKPQESFVNYAGFIIRAINDWRAVDPVARREVWLCSDVRNYLKCRDLALPPIGVLAQFDWHKTEKHYRWNTPGQPWAGSEWSEPNVWSSRHDYHYARLELVGIRPDTSFYLSPELRNDFGMIVNENRAYVSNDRKSILKEWVLPMQPSFIHGKWSDKSLAELGVDIQPTPWETIGAKMAQVRCTLTTPASGSGWATAKPWECFASGTICFFHPDYDSQDHILADAPPELHQWLRVDTPAELKQRIDMLSADHATWEWLARMQRAHFDKAMAESLAEQTIGRWAGL